MRERLFEIIRKEYRQAFREPRMRFMLFLPPIIQLLIFGFAVNLDVDHGQIAWEDGDRSYESRELLAAFQASGRLEVAAVPSTDREAQALLDSSKVDLVVHVLPDRPCWNLAALAPRDPWMELQRPPGGRKPR